MRFFLFFIIASCVFAEGMLSIRSDDVKYDGRSINLRGNVSIKHDLGAINTDQAELEFIDSSRNAYFQMLRLCGNVRIYLEDEGSLSCSNAVVNYLTLKGSFYGSSATMPVIYEDHYKDDNKEVPLCIQSMKMDLLLNNKQNSPHCHVDHIIAAGNVFINYNNECIALADKAIYNRINKHPYTSLQSCMINLIPKRVKGICRIIHRNGDVIDASSITIDRTQENIVLANPQGKLIDINGKNIQFKSDDLYWFQKESLLKLHNNIIIEDSFTRLINDNEVCIKQETIDGQKEWNECICYGETILSHNMAKHSLTTYHKMTINHYNRETLLESQMDGNTKQVFYTDNMGNMQANTMKIYYDIVKGKIQIGKISIDGNIRILNKAPFSKDNKKLTEQYIIADHAEYFPSTETLLLTGENQQRVLFYDKLNDVQLSANRLEMQRNKKLDMPSIRSIGNVCIKFNKDEFEKIKKNFF